MTRLTHFSEKHLFALAERATASAVCWLLKAEKCDQIALLYGRPAMEDETKAKRLISPGKIAIAARDTSEQARQYAARAKELVTLIRSRDPNAQLPVYRPDGYELKMWFVAFDKELPMPGQVKTLNDLRLKRVKDYGGTLEVGVGDYLIGESPMRRKEYQLKTFVCDGELEWVDYHKADMKRQISAAIRLWPTRSGPLDHQGCWTSWRNRQAHPRRSSWLPREWRSHVAVNRFRNLCPGSETHGRRGGRSRNPASRSHGS